MGDVKLTSTGGGSVTLTPPSTASNYTVTLPAATSTLIDTTSTQTLTNKTIASLVTTGTATFGGIVNTGSTGQVQFPATQNPSSDANTLDDYEEGTWTPTFVYASGGSTAPTISQTLNFRYTKIGRLVSISGYVYFSNAGSGSTLRCLGLPFANAIAYSMQPLWTAYASTPLGFYMSSGSAAMELGLLLGSSAGVTSSNLPSEVSVQSFYFTTT